MKTARRKRKKSKIRTFRAPAGVATSELVRALQKDKYFARVDKQGRIVTNAPL
jgi:hypothetical protein